MTFTISNDELKTLNKWMEEKSNGFKPMGTIGGQFTYSFTPTSLGVVVKVKNNASGKEIDITDYLDW